MPDTDFWITPGGFDDQARGFDMYADLASSATRWVQNHRVGSSDEYPLYAEAAKRANNIEDGLVTFFGHI